MSVSKGWLMSQFKEYCSRSASENYRRARLVGLKAANKQPNESVQYELPLEHIGMLYLVRDYSEKKSSPYKLKLDASEKFMKYFMNSPLSRNTHFAFDLSDTEFARLEKDYARNIII